MAGASRGLSTSPVDNHRILWTKLGPLGVDFGQSRVYRSPWKSRTGPKRKRFTNRLVL